MQQLLIAIQIFVLIIIAGCASTKSVPISDEAINKEKTHKVVVSQRQKPSFIADRNNGLSNGALGVAINHSASSMRGNKITASYAISDPAKTVSAELLRLLAEKYDILVQEGEIPLVGGEDAEDLARLYENADYVLDVRTTYWGVSAYPSYLPVPFYDNQKYRVIYSAELRLIDTSKQTSVATGLCRIEPEKDNESPTYDELLSNNGERLKEELAGAASQCVEKFRNESLRI